MWAYHAVSEQNVQKLHKVEIRRHNFADQSDTHGDHLTGILKLGKNNQIAIRDYNKIEIFNLPRETNFQKLDKIGMNWP